MPQQNDDQIAELIAAARELVDGINALTGDTGNQLVGLSRTSRMNRRMITLLAGSLVLNLVLTFSALRSNSRLDALTHRLDVAQTSGRQNALCPLYGVFLAAKNSKSRANYPQGPEAYDRAFQVIQDGFVALNCTEFGSK